MHTRSLSVRGAAGRGRLALLGALCVLVAFVAPMIAANRARAAGPLDHYNFSPSSMPGTTTVTLTPVDAANAPLGNGVHVFLSFNPAAGVVPPARATANGRDLNASPTDITTGTDGTIRIAYTVGGSPTVSSNVSDVITAQNAATAPTVTGSVSHAYGVVSLAFTDDAGKNITGQAQPVSVGGNPICFEITTQKAGDSAWLTSQTAQSLSGSFLVGPAETGGTDQSCKNNPFPQQANQLGRVNSTVPIQVRSDANKKAYVYYVPAAPSTGGVRQNEPMVIDTVTATDTPSTPTVKINTSFFYGSFNYRFDKTPMATAGSLAQGDTVFITVQATDGAGKDVKQSVPVFLLFDRGGPSNNASASVASPLTGGRGSAIASIPASNAPCPNQANVTNPYFTQDDGTLLIAYTAGSASPAPDVLSAKNDCAIPSFTVKTGYSYGAPGYLFLPTPIAAPGSIPGGQSKAVTVHAFDAGDPSGNTASTAQVFLTISGSGPAGAPVGSATATDGSGTKTLSAIPQAFTPSAQGNVAINYTAPASPPSSGSDTITAQNAASSPAVTVTDSYS